MVIEVDGYKIEYKLSGLTKSGNIRKRNVAVVLQGWGTELSMYDSVASAIEDKYSVVQVDLPGFGKSDEPREAWSVDDYSDFFCKFAEALGIRKTVLIGHSYGGRMIIKMAARATSGELPFEIDKIMLIDSAGVMPARSSSQNFKIKRYKIIKKIITSDSVHALFPEVIDYWLSRQGSEDYKNASPVMKECLVKAVNEDLQEIMPLVKCDTLLVWGDKDPDTPIEDAYTMESLMPNAAIVTIEGAGHYSFLEQPVLFRSIIRSYLGLDNASKTASKVNDDTTKNKMTVNERGGGNK